MDELRRLGDLVGKSISRPDEAAHEVLGLNLGRNTLFQALLLVTAVSVLLVVVLDGSMISLPFGPDQIVEVTPFHYGTILFAALLLLSFAIHFTGAAMGGRGLYNGALATVVWLEVLAIALRSVQTVLILLSPPIAVVFSLVGVAVLIWCLLNFINVLHGFDSLGKAAATLLLGVFGILVGTSVILSLILVGSGAATTGAI